MHRFWMHTNPLRLVDQETGKQVPEPFTINMDRDVSTTIDGVLQIGELHSWVEAPGYGRVEAYIVLA